MPTPFEEAFGVAVHEILGLDVPEETYLVLDRHFSLVREISERHGLDLLPFPGVEETVAAVHGNALLAYREAGVEPGARILDVTEEAGAPGLLVKCLVPEARLVVSEPSVPAAEVLRIVFGRLEVEGADLTGQWLDAEPAGVLAGGFDLILLPGEVPPEELLPMAVKFRKPHATMALWGVDLPMVRLERMAEGEVLDIATVDNPLHAAAGYTVVLFRPSF